MAAAKKRTGDVIGQTGAQAITHDDTRVNNPTADAADLVTTEVEETRTVTYPRVPWLPAENRDRALDPQLVWTGKDEADRGDLTVTAPAIFRQELIRPQVLVNELFAETRARQSAGAAEEDEYALFASSDILPDADLDELDKVEWYEHPMKWTNRMILGDSLQVMASLVEREDLRGKVQMVYIDPPYGIKFGSNWQASADNSRVRDGKLEDVTREVEQIKAFRDTWELGISSYLSYLRDRFVATRDLLTESGSVLVQIGDENIHLVRSLLDEVFGAKNFVSLITFKTTSGAGSFAGGTNVIPAVANYLIWYARDIELVKYRQLYRPKSLVGDDAYVFVETPDGERRRMTAKERETGIADGRIFRKGPTTSQTTRVGQTTVFPVEIPEGRFLPTKGGWKTNEAGMERLKWANRLTGAAKTLYYVRYHDDFPVASYTNLWDDTTTAGFGSEKLYVVQTNTKVIERCMLMCTDPGDLVLDPTCGSGTTAHVAEQWGRRWITIDTSRVALALSRHRIMGAKYPAYYLADSDVGQAKEASLAKLPKPGSRSRTKDGKEAPPDIRKGFVYERVPHITLKAIANNPEIKSGMSRLEIDAAIQKYAEYETLFDRAYEQPRALRVAGPFTMESLSPHRALAADNELPASEQIAEELPGNDSYTELILDHVKKAGVQNGRRNERIEFEVIELVSGRTLTAVGIRKHAEEDTASRLGIALGPENATVDQLFIKNAAREALAARNLDMLLILGFAFDANALEAVADLKPEDAGEFAEVVRQRTVGKMPVLLVRMNPDLAMGNELANTGAGNLFTVFGEPDVAVTELEDGKIQVEILGVDTFNPITTIVRSNSPDDIMLWTLDTNYNSEAFVVRHVYFQGKEGKPAGMDPYRQLKQALKADIDEEAWASLYQVKSRPFPRPETGKIAVKVVDRYGNEVLKVVEV